VKLQRNCLSINTYFQALEILNIYKDSKIIPVFYFKYNLINKLSVNWLTELIDILESKFGKNKFKTYVNVKINYGLFINLFEIMSVPISI
jgi:hypothetical protein